MSEKKKTAKAKSKSTWEVLSQVDCSEHIEQKGGFNYLSWAWAWGILMEHCPDATFENHLNENGYPCFFDSEGYGIVRVTLCINGKCHTEDFPVLDYRNKAIQNPDSFSVNTALKRCLVKCMAYFGLGHYIYAGEDTPNTPFDREHALSVIEAYKNFTDKEDWEKNILEYFKVKSFDELKDENLEAIVNKISTTKEQKND